MKILITLMVALVVPLWLSPALAVEPTPLRGRHLIAFNVGILSDVGSSASVTAGDGVSIGADGNGAMAGLRYSYWFDEDVALDLGVGVMDSDASVRVNGGAQVTQAATVTRLLFGMRYQPAAMAMSRNLRPYVVGSIGSYSSNVSGVRTEFTGVEIGSYSDTAVGGRVAVGFDALVTNWLDLGVEGGYGFVGDFDREVGGQRNFSSPEFLFVLGVSLGGGE